MDAAESYMHFALYPKQQCSRTEREQPHLSKNSHWGGNKAQGDTWTILWYWHNLSSPSNTHQHHFDCLLFPCFPQHSSQSIQSLSLYFTVQLPLSTLTSLFKETSIPSAVSRQFLTIFWGNNRSLFKRAHTLQNSFHSCLILSNAGTIYRHTASSQVENTIEFLLSTPRFLLVSLLINLTTSNTCDDSSIHPSIHPLINLFQLTNILHPFWDKYSHLGGQVVKSQNISLFPIFVTSYPYWPQTTHYETRTTLTYLFDHLKWSSNDTPVTTIKLWRWEPGGYTNYAQRRCCSPALVVEYRRRWIKI